MAMADLIKMRNECGKHTCCLKCCYKNECSVLNIKLKSLYIKEPCDWTDNDLRGVHQILKDVVDNG